MPFKKIKSGWDKTRDIVRPVTQLGAIAGNPASAIHAGADMFMDAIGPTAQGFIDQARGKPIGGGVYPQGTTFPSEMPPAGVSLEDTLAAIQAMEDSTNRLIERNIERFPRVAQTALDTVMRDLPGINDFMRGELERSMDHLYPQWREEIIKSATDSHGSVDAIARAFRQNVVPHAMQAADDMSRQMIANNESMLRGEIPDDVAQQVRRQSAELGQQIGVRGQAQQFLTGRDLGLTSLQIMERGHEMAPNTMAFAPQAYGQLAQMTSTPMQSASNLTDLLGAYRPQLADAGQMYSGFTGGLLGISAVNPTQAMASGMNMLSQDKRNAMDAWQFGVTRQDNINAMNIMTGGKYAGQV